MLIDEQVCHGCGECVPYCVVDAIVLEDGVSRIVEDECVECGACLRADVCPNDAFYLQPLEWPRSLRAQFSDPLGVHPKTGIPGRGTEEIKTNDVTDRVKPGFAGMAVEFGRPSVGTRLSDVEKVAMALSNIGVEHEPANPVTFLMTDLKTGKMQDDVLNERVLSAIVEFIVPEAKAVQVLDVLKEMASQVDTVYSASTWPCAIAPTAPFRSGRSSRMRGITWLPTARPTSVSSTHRRPVGGER